MPQSTIKLSNYEVTKYVPALRSDNINYGFHKIIFVKLNVLKVV